MPMHGLELIIIPIVLVAILLGVLTTIFWVWMLIDCATNKTLRDNQKIGWIIAILFTHLIGAIIYYFVVRTPRLAQAREGYQAYQQPQQPYSSYQQGYQSGETPRAYQPGEQQQHIQERPPERQPQYEQIQAPYPEDPPAQAR
jgi:hypothetical protein